MSQQTRRPYPMEISPPTPESLTALTQRNIELIAQFEAIAAAKGSAADRVADAITRFGGSMVFVYVHVGWFGGWILWHCLPGWPQASRFDPYPFQLLTFVVSLEAIFPSTFILISQNRQNRMNELRNHLDLQINLLSEQENSKMLARLEALLRYHGLVQPDLEVASLEEATQPDMLAQDTCIKQTKEARVFRRAQAVRHVVQGQRLHTVSDALSFTSSALRKWGYRFSSQGGVQGLVERPRSGRLPKSTCALAQLLNRLVDQEP